MWVSIVDRSREWFAQIVCFAESDILLTQVILPQARNHILASGISDLLLEAFQLFAPPEYCPSDSGFTSLLAS
jgi:hypothetical protein